MARSSNVTNPQPFTPIRKLSAKLGPGKRGRGCQHPSEAKDDQEPFPAAVLSQKPSPGSSLSAQPACLALQNEDTSEDVVIITTLNSVPFCCHEDLLTMPRDQLIRVASALNVKLPAALRIDVRPCSSDARIRNSIELVVGLRGDVPPAPKAVKLQSGSDLHKSLKRSPSTSPLTVRTRSRDFSTSYGMTKLAKLDEMDEDSMVVDRPAKKRKVSPSTDGLPPFLRFDDSPSPTTARTLMRVKTHIGVTQRSPTPRRLLRSSSLKYRGEAKITGRPNFTFVSLTRPRPRPRPRTRNEDIYPVARVQVADPISTIDPPSSAKTQALKDSTNANTNSTTKNRHADGIGRLPRSAPSNLVDNFLSCQRNQIDVDEGSGLVADIGGMGRATNESPMDVCDT